MNLPTLIDVALGLSLVYLVLASIGSVLAELWAAHCKIRHRLLRNTVNRLLGPDIAARFWEHSLILPLYEPPPEEEEEETGTEGKDLLGKTKRYASIAVAKSWKLTASVPRWLVTGGRAEAPAYLDAPLFATVVLDLASGRGALGPIPNDRASWEAVIKVNIEEVQGDANDLRDHLLALLRQLPADTPDVAAAIKVAVTKWYEEAMQRASGTYRRKTQKTLLVIGGILALGLNVDAVRITQILYLNPQLRSDVAAQAEAVALDKESPTPEGAAGLAKTPRAQLRESAAQLRDLAKVGFPLGWMPEIKDNFIHLPTQPKRWWAQDILASWRRSLSLSVTTPWLRLPLALLGETAETIVAPGWIPLLAKILGLAASALAVCLGAPFWFDVIGRLVKLRSSAGAEAEKGKAPAATVTAAPVSSVAANISAAPVHAPEAITPTRPLPSATAALAPSSKSGFDAARAYWLAEFADHAYETNSTLLGTWLQQQGFTLKKSFNNAATDTQGFLAVADNIAVLAFRGTEKELKDWFTDAKVTQVADPTQVIPGALHAGFIAAFNSVAAAVDAELDALKAAGATLHVTGHSLGAALATLAALHAEGRTPSAGLVSTVHTYGSPRVGDPRFAAAFERAFRDRAFRLVNNEDIVTRVPPPQLELALADKAPPAFDYQHVGEMKFIDAQGKIMGDVSFMFRLLNFTTNALDSLRTAVATALNDHSMQRYCAFLRQAGQTVRFNS